MTYTDLINEFKYMFQGQYRINADGVTQGHVQTTKDETGRIVSEKWIVDKVVSAKAILPVAIMDNLDSATQKIQIAMWDQKRWKKLIVNREKLTNSSKIISLADQGLPVGSDNCRTISTYFNSLLSAFDERIPRHTARSVMGWLEQDDKRIFMPYASEVEFDGDDTYRYLYASLKRKGTLEEWVKYVEPLRYTMEIRLIMAASFASPLIELIGENPFVTHLWGGTGTAKTVALLIAGSIWGNPALGKLARTMNMTPTAMLSTAAFLNSIPFLGDELQTIKNRWSGTYDSLIMQITEGIDRGRMKFDQVQETKSWRCSFLFTGEEPCVKAVSGGGVANRVVQIEVKDKLVPNGNETANFFKTHYGCAGPEYIGAIRSGFYDLQAMYASYFSELIKSDTTDKQAGAMALMLTGDKVAHELFWPNEPDFDPAWAVQYLADAKQVSVSERAYQYICGLVSENSNNFIAEDNNYPKVIWGKHDVKNNVVYIGKTVLNRIMTDAGYDFEACKKAWDRNGYIGRDSNGRIQHYVSCNGVPTYCIKLHLPGKDNDELLTDYNGAVPFGEE